MKETGVVVAVPEAAGSSRQRSQVAREKWEENWIAQQRDVTAVIEQPARSSSTEVVTGATRGTAGEPPAASRPDISPDHGRSVPAANAAEPTHRIMPQNVRTTRPANSPLRSSVSPTQVAMRTDQLFAGESAHTGGAGAPQQTRQCLRQFAFWREEAAVDVAMRLREPRRDANSVIEQLRHWLRECGARLRKVRINGRTIWPEQTAAREAPANERGPAFSRHI